METVESAQRLLLRRLRPLGTERVALRGARGRILARPVVARADLPPWPNSSMDGYAVRARETSVPPVRLPVIGEVRAGDPPGRTLANGTTCRIMTGAPLPIGADAVVRHEDTDNARDTVEILVAVAAGTAVRAAGNDLRTGDVPVPAGRRLRAADMAIIAALGEAGVVVHRRPRVGLLSTGAELIDAGNVPGPGETVDSNAVALGALVEEAGGIPIALGIVGDERARIAERLRGAAGQCDLIVSCAGVSVGDHDHVRGAVEDTGTIEMWQVAMRPGRPLVIGEVGGTPFVGLPGNPVSAQVTFELFVRPAILAMQGAGVVHRPRGVARAAEAVSKPVGLETYHRAVLVEAADDAPDFRLTGDQNSGRMRSLADADCLVVLAAADGHIPAGTLVPTIPLQ